jgi:ergothioneine biosynthesis protein EgtB
MSNLQDLRGRFQQVRRRSEELCKTLETEDFVVQAIPDVSPPKWHLAHTTWFFETFLLSKYLVDYEPVCPEYGLLFNSYYNAVGPQWHRASRGHLSRPTVSEVRDYRRQVDASVQDLFERIEDSHLLDFCSLMELGLNHEQQHQELLLTDIKYNFSINPLRPVLRDASESVRPVASAAIHWIDVSGGRYQVGQRSSGSFCFDNELPCHEVLLQDFRIASRLTTCAEYIEFIEEGGYETPQFWLSDGWDWVCREHCKAPLYWEKIEGSWGLMTLSGFREVLPSEPVCHVSHFEADAFATWAGKRLLTEFEWEVAAEAFRPVADEGNFADDEVFHPVPAVSEDGVRLAQMLGDVWEWTASAYLPYPGFRPGAGAIGEYNGKFMSGQMVLRGGSTATPRDHIRNSYRNFFQPEKRWQFSGIRLGEGP